MSPPRPLPALLLGNGTHPIPRPLRPALSDIKAPLRAKDFEKVRSAPAPYRVPAPARASRKFRVSAASPLRSSCPKVSKDRLVTSRPAPGSRLRPKGGTEGREGRDLFEGRARWAPRACRTPRRRPPAPPPGTWLRSRSRWAEGRAGAPRALPAARNALASRVCLCFSAGQEGVLRCHPDLAGSELQRGTLSAESQREQSGAGLARLGAGERLRLAELNAQYRARFGFPFVLAARRSDAAAVPGELARRLRCPPEQELRTALGEVKKICRLRLADLLGRDRALR